MEIKITLETTKQELLEKALCLISQGYKEQGIALLGFVGLILGWHISELEYYLEEAKEDDRT